MTDLLKQFRQKSKRALGRIISIVENQAPEALDLLSELYPEIKGTSVLGITGPPGAGKSTLINLYVRYLRERSQSVAVIAVDPMSPFSGGALLGDRIRLSSHYNDPEVFIRSLSNRGKLGGLSLATREVIHVLDAFGFDQILIETVGVGQNEVDIHQIADVTTLILGPDAGDAVQAHKAGILEIPDVIIVNKSEKEGSEQVLKEIRKMLQIAKNDQTLLLKTTIQDENTARLALDATLAWSRSHEALINKRRNNQSRKVALELIQTTLSKKLDNWLNENWIAKSNPYKDAKSFLSRSVKDVLG